VPKRRSNPARPAANTRKPAGIRHRKERDRPVPRNAEKFRNSAVAAAIVAAVLGAVLPFVLPRIFSSPSKSAPGPSPQIEVDAVRVQDDNGSALMTVLLRNKGNQVAIIKSAQFLVRRAAVLPLCMSQGALASSGTYPVTVPPAPRSGQILSAPTNLQEPPDSPDRFSFRLGLPAGALRGISVYDFEVSLSYDVAPKPVPAGEVLVSLPSVPDASYVWTKTAAVTHMAGDGSASQIAEWSQCMVRNSKAIESMLKSPAVRSSGLAGLASTIAYCCTLTDSVDKTGG
jgi:hypothetical protein